jgi:hypothetical protein
MIVVIARNQLNTKITKYNHNIYVYSQEEQANL